ncbi:MAG: beta strand repeat-containing protein [Elusimicrobiota bacterium]
MRPAAGGLFLLLALVGIAGASAPAVLTYQGRLKEAGLPVTGYRTADIQICDSFTGGTCNTSGVQGVSVVNGVFRTTFTVPAGVALESGSWFVEVHVNGATFSPREMLSANAYSVYSSSASALIANPGSNYVTISTPVAFAAQDAAGYSVLLSSGISTPNGVVRAKAFFGDGSGLTGLPSSTDITKVFKTGDTMTGNLNILASTLTLTGANGNIVTAASVTASAFFGDGQHLTGIVASGSVLKTGDAMSGNLAINNSTLTVNGPIFSTGTGGGTPFTGTGTRFMWIPSSAAVRAGVVAGALWDPVNIGVNSVAFGNNTSATANFSTVGGGNGNTANGAWGVVAGGQNNTAGFNAAVAGGAGNSAGGLYSFIPGGFSNTIGGSGQYSFAAGDQANANGQGEFVWADSQGTPLFGTLRDQFLVRAMGGFDIQSSSFIFTNGVSTFVYVDNTGLAMATGSSITLSGINGVIVTQSSITAARFFGDGSQLTGVTAAGAVQKAGDTMAGNLEIDNSTLTVNGPLISTGTTGGVVFTGAGTRFMWVPSLGAIRAGAAIGAEWDAASIGINSVAFGQNNKASGNQSVVSGGIGNGASGIYATVPGGYLNNAAGGYSFAAGAQAQALAQGSFVWADALFSNLTSNIQNQFLVRAMGGFDIQSSSFIFTNGVSTFVYVDNTGLAMATGSSITLSGLNGVIVTGSSITAARFFGDGSQLTGVTAAGAVQKTGDAMSGNLAVDNSTLTVNGPIISTGTGGGLSFTGAGTRFMWVPSSAAFRAGAVAGNQWDPVNLGPQSVAFGQDNAAAGAYSAIGGGAGNQVSATSSYGTVAGGSSGAVLGFGGVIGGGLLNTVSGQYGTVPGGTGNTAAGLASFAAGFDAKANAQGSFIWADSAGGAGAPITNNVADSFLVRALGGFDIISSTYYFTNGLSTFVYVNATGLAMQTGSSITLSGINGVIVTQSSITAARFFGDGSQLIGVVSTGSVNRAGDAMSGNLAINNSTLTVNGPLISTGTSGAVVFSGAGTRFEWIPSSGAIRAGQLTAAGNPTAWDAFAVGAFSVAFGQDNQAAGPWSVVGGGGGNSTGGPAWYATISGGNGNNSSNLYTVVAGGKSNTSNGFASAIGGGFSNFAGGDYSTIPGGSNNSAGGFYSFAAGFKASSNAEGAFTWADSVGGVGAPITNYVTDSFLVRAMGGFDVIASSFVFSNSVSTLVYIRSDGNVGIGTTNPGAMLDVNGMAQFGPGGAKSTFTAAGLTMNNNGSLYLSGPSGIIISASSITAGAFFGDASNLTNGPPDNSKVLKTGDGMTGPLTMLSNSTITVTGNQFSVGGSTFKVLGSSVGVGAIDPTALFSVVGPGGISASGGIQTDGFPALAGVVEANNFYTNGAGVIGHTGTGGNGIIWGDGGGGAWVHQDFYVGTQLFPMFRMTTSGVGVGGAGPLNRLDVGGGGIAVGSYAGVDLASNGSAILSGTVSIGTAAANEALDVYAAPLVGVAESVAKFSVGDADVNQFVQILNNTTTNGEFDPKIAAHVTGTTAPPLLLEANSGSNDAVASDSFVMNALSGVGTLVNRNLLNVQNNGISKFVLTAGGGVGIGAPPPSDGSLVVSPANVVTSQHGVVVEKTGINSTAGFEFKDSAFGRTWQFGGNLGNFGDGRLQVYDETTAQYRQVFFGNGDISIGMVGAGDAQSATPGLYLQANGKIGIGTNAPVYDVSLGKAQRTIGVEDQGAVVLLGSTLTVRSGGGGTSGSGGAGGPLILAAGAGGGAGPSNGGPVVLSAGNAGTTGIAGSIIMAPGQGPTAGSIQFGDPNNFPHWKSVQQVSSPPGVSFPACGTLAGGSITLSPGSTDMAGQINLTTGAGAGAANCVITVTFGKAYGNSAANPLHVFITPASASVPALNAWAAAVTGPLSGTFTITLTGVPAPATAYTFAYLVVE